MAPPQWVRRLRAGQPTKILTYGTSLTAGGAWVAQITKWMDEQFHGAAHVENVVAGAMWSQWGVEYLSERVLSHAPDVLSVHLILAFCSQRATAIARS